ncbi:MULTISPECIES: hypothetical protein [unclassified Endozoicomonas]|uniref:hypothetical protein n=1 Tax=unclassified Endozoicomonas TaxID=2644528 RepID=UPI003BB6BD78
MNYIKTYFLLWRFQNEMKYFRLCILTLLLFIVLKPEAAFERIIIKSDKIPVLEITAKYNHQASRTRNIVPDKIIVRSLLSDTVRGRLGTHSFFTALENFSRSLYRTGIMSMTAEREYSKNFTLSFANAPSLLLRTPAIDMMDWQVVFSHLNQDNLLYQSGCQIPGVHPLILFFSSDFLNYLDQNILTGLAGSQAIQIPLLQLTANTENYLTDDLVFTESANETDLIINIYPQGENQVSPPEGYTMKRFFEGSLKHYQ